MLHSDSTSEQKEICFKGRSIFMGYLHDDEKTKEIMGTDGWLHTGDLGFVDKDGWCTVEFTLVLRFPSQGFIILLDVQRNS